MPDSHSDTWIPAAQAGDRAAFARVVRQYREPVYRMLCQLTQHDAIAQDLTQETFLRAWKALAQYQPRETSPLAWLLTIARNLAMNHFNQQRQQRHALAELPASLRDKLRSTNSAQLQNMIQVEERRLLREVILSLSPEERELLQLRFAASYPVDEIAALLRLPSATVRKRISRLYEKLQALLKSGDFPSLS